MKHDVRLRGRAFGLRPAEVSDCAFIVGLRSAAGHGLNRGATSVEAQQAWMERYFARDDDYYFVVERVVGGGREGLAGIYDVDRDSRCAEWGRFVLRDGSVAAVEAAMLVYRCAFETMGLDRVYCRTLADNSQVIAFHDSCGLARSEAEVMVGQDGAQRAAIEHSLRHEAWPPIRDRLDRLVARIAGSIDAFAATRR
jgi:RimJ/RimL family protein N-acetyltransferase